MNILENSLQLSTFFSGLKATLDTAKQYQRIHDRELALNFNPLLSFFDVKENRFSKILAFFLDPRESHGQGDVFLKAFLAQTGLQEQVGSFIAVDVQTEKATDENRRVDIFINFDKGRYAIGIENKIWARDQENQLRDYNAYLKNYFGERYCLIYMPPYQRDADTWTLPLEERIELEAAKRYHCFDHSAQTTTLLELWIQWCRAPNVCTFLKHLHQFIEHEINGETFMGQKEIVADYLENNLQFLDVAFALPQVIAELCARAVPKIKNDVVALAARRGLEVRDVDIDYWSAETGFTFVIRNGAKRELWIRFEFERNQFQSYFYGVLGAGANKPRRVSVEGELATRLGRCDEHPTLWWSWWKWHENKNDVHRILEGVHSGAFVKDVEGKLDALLPKILDVLDSNTPID